MDRFNGPGRSLAWGLALSDQTILEGEEAGT